MKHWIPLLFLLISSNAYAQHSDLIKHVIKQLDLDHAKLKSEFITSKIRPNNSNETIVVIPEIVTEDDEYFELNSYIVIVDNSTGKIIHNYFESALSNEWYSDAIRLEKISIDTAPYSLTDQDQAFGIRVHYYGSSQPNPYSLESISLFHKDGNTLKKVLVNYAVKQYNGEWDTNCTGSFVNQEKILIISNQKTNGYADIIVNNKITATENYVDQYGDCEHFDEISTVKTILTYNNKEYE